MVVHGALAAWVGQYVGSSDVRCVRDRMLALWRADGVVIRQPPTPAEALSRLG